MSTDLRELCCKCGQPITGYASGSRSRGWTHPFDCLAASSPPTTRTAPDLRTLAKKATPGPWNPDGPWWWDRDPDGGPCVSMVTAGADRTPVAIMPMHGYLQGERDAAFIAAVSPDVVLALLDELDALRVRSRQETPQCPFHYVAMRLGADDVWRCGFERADGSSCQNTVSGQ